MGHRQPRWILFFDRLRWEAALATCAHAAWECSACLSFIDPEARIARFSENIILESSTEGDPVLDILSDRSVAGIEFLSRI